MADRETREKELSKLLEKHGCVRASDVVKSAAPKRAPLHDEFEWNDQVAGHAYRLSQARRIIRITVVRDNKGGQSRFVHVPNIRIEGPTAVDQPREGVYKPAREVVRDPGEFDRALRELLTQRNAMDATIKDLQRAAKNEKKDVEMLQQLVTSLVVARNIIRLMLRQ